MQNISGITLADLSAEQAYSVGSVVGNLIKNGMPVSQAENATAKIVDFIRRGQQAQAAVDEIIAAWHNHNS